jgi:hypothetical protein
MHFSLSSDLPLRHINKKTRPPNTTNGKRSGCARYREIVTHASTPAWPWLLRFNQSNDDGRELALHGVKFDRRAFVKLCGRRHCDWVGNVFLVLALNHSPRLHPKA